MTAPQLLAVLVQALLTMRAEPARTRARRALALAAACQAYDRMARLTPVTGAPDEPPNAALLDLSLAALSEIDHRGYDALLVLANHAANLTRTIEARRDKRDRGDR